METSQLSARSERKINRNINYKGYVYWGHDSEHTLIAERILGKKLPKGAVVHHVDGNRSNNSNDNLVICQDTAYHRLLHQRLNALKNSGNPNYLRCYFCGKYDDPKNLVLGFIKNFNGYHRDCKNKYRRNFYKKYGK